MLSEVLLDLSSFGIDWTVGVVVLEGVEGLPMVVGFVVHAFKYNS
jgi:hypothetical protein